MFSKFKIATLKWDKKEGDFFMFLSKIKSEKGIILDVGANLGIMTAHLSHKFPNQTILAIEPMPDNLHVLHRLASEKRWKNVEFAEVAVGSESGWVTMILPELGKTKMQGLSHVKCDEITEWTVGQELEVPLSTLDDLVKGQHVSAIKMDVENYEYTALMGAKEILAKSKPILYIELWDNDNRQQCFQLLQEFGYSAHVVVNGTLVPYLKSKHKHQNFLFLSN